jgi:glycosyltransferase involved in cell wall biosynthesis
MDKKIAFITNICTHYTAGLFEKLGQMYDIDFLFYSDENEWYWQNQHGKTAGDFQYRYLPGLRIGRTKISFELVIQLLKNPYQIYIKCINGKFALPVTYLIAKIKRKPFILWTGIWMRLNTPFHKMIYPLTLSIYKNSDAIVVYGSHVKRFLISEGVDEKKIFIATHSVDNTFYSRKVSDLEVEEVKKTLQIHSDDKVILFLGRLEKNKGVDNLLFAFSRLISEGTKFQNVTLLIAGEGGERKRLEAICSELNISLKVKFCGYVPITEAVKYYSISSIFVLPSITTDRIKETWGLVINEAMNQSIPVIVSDSVGAGAGGLIKHGLNGIIYPESDIQKLYESLKYLLENEDTRILMGENAKKEIANWNYDQMRSGFIQAINYVQGLNKIE